MIWAFEETLHKAKRDKHAPKLGKQTTSRSIVCFCFSCSQPNHRTYLHVISNDASPGCEPISVHSAKSQHGKKNGLRFKTRPALGLGRVIKRIESVWNFSCFYPEHSYTPVIAFFRWKKLINKMWEDEPLHVKSHSNERLSSASRAPPIWIKIHVAPKRENNHLQWLWANYYSFASNETPERSFESLINTVSFIFTQAKRLITTHAHCMSCEFSVWVCGCRFLL